MGGRQTFNYGLYAEWLVEHCDINVFCDLLEEQDENAARYVKNFYNELSHPSPADNSANEFEVFLRKEHADFLEILSATLDNNGHIFDARPVWHAILYMAPNRFYHESKFLDSNGKFLLEKFIKSLKKMGYTKETFVGAIKDYAFSMEVYPILAQILRINPNNLPKNRPVSNPDSIFDRFLEPEAALTLNAALMDKSMTGEWRSDDLWEAIAKRKLGENFNKADFLFGYPYEFDLIKYIAFLKKNFKNLDELNQEFAFHGHPNRARYISELRLSIPNIAVNKHPVVSKPFMSPCLRDLMVLEKNGIEKQLDTKRLQLIAIELQKSSKQPARKAYTICNSIVNVFENYNFNKSDYFINGKFDILSFVPFLKKHFKTLDDFLKVLNEHLKDPARMEAIRDGTGIIKKSDLENFIDNPEVKNILISDLTKKSRSPSWQAREVWRALGKEVLKNLYLDSNFLKDKLFNYPPFKDDVLRKCETVDNLIKKLERHVPEGHISTLRSIQNQMFAKAAPVQLQQAAPAQPMKQAPAQKTKAKPLLEEEAALVAVVQALCQEGYTEQRIKAILVLQGVQLSDSIIMDAKPDDEKGHPDRDAIEINGLIAAGASEQNINEALDRQVKKQKKEANRSLCDLTVDNGYNNDPLPVDIQDTFANILQEPSKNPRAERGTQVWQEICKKALGNLFLASNFGRWDNNENRFVFDFQNFISNLDNNGYTVNRLVDDLTALGYGDRMSAIRQYL